jgi:hypothetical protein
MEIERAEHREPKRGQKCCGCCCDMRRATIIVNAVWVVIETIDLIVLVSRATSARHSSDVKVQAKYESIKRYIVGILIAQILALVLGTGAILGAIKFRAWPVVINIVYVVIAFILLMVDTAKASHHDSAYTVNIPARVTIFLIILALLIYPQAVFVREVKTATMTKETYINEEYSCCCI